MTGFGAGDLIKFPWKAAPGALFGVVG